MQMTRLRVDDGNRTPKFRRTEGDVSPFPADLSQKEGILTTFSGKEWSGSRRIVTTPGETQSLGKNVGQTLVGKFTYCLRSGGPFQERCRADMNVLLVDNEGQHLRGK